MRTSLDASPDVSAALDGLHAAVARLAAAAASAHADRAPQDHHVPAIACDPDSLAALQALEAAESALHAERARLLVQAAGEAPEVLGGRVCRGGEGDSQVADVRAVEIGAVLGCTPQRARSLVHEARILVLEIPRVLVGLRSGQVTAYQSRLAAGAWRDLVHRHEAAMSTVDHLLAERFQTRILRRAHLQTAAEFKRTLATSVAALSPAVGSALPDPRDERHVHVQPDGNGMAWLTAYLDIVSATRVMQVLEHTARHDHTLSGTLSQKQADALVAIVDGVSTISPTARAQAAEVQVLVSWEAMLETAAALRDGRVPDTALFGEIVGTGAVVEGGALLDLMGRASFRRLIIDERTGQLLDYGRTTYRPPMNLRDHIRGRDRTCRAPGCIRPARVADVDHVIPWDSGGRTSEANLAALCRTHHVLKTHGDWSYASDRDGAARWVLPSGIVIDRPPGEYLDHAVGRKAARAPSLTASGP